MNKTLFLKLGKQKELKLFLLPVFFFLLVLTGTFLVSAAPPVTTVQQFTEGIIVEYPSMDYLKQGSYFDFHFHLFNQSNGRPIITGTTCYTHLYNSTGNHVYKGFDNEVSNEFDYAFMVEGGNFSQLGTYYYITQCNNSALGGYAERAFTVTADGRSIDFTNMDNAETFNFFWILLLIAVITITIGIWKEDANISLLGAIMLFAFGLYSVINGIAGIKDTYTNIFSLTIIGVAIIITAKCMEDFLSNLNGL